MAGKKTLIEKNVEKYILNNFDKKDRKKDKTLHFEWFASSMHIWNECSQAYNANTKIGKDVGLGDSQGADSFYVIVNNGEQLFSLKSDIDSAVSYVKSNAKLLNFVFIQTKLTSRVNWGDFLNLIEVPLNIWKGNSFPSSQPILAKVKEFIDALIDEDDFVLGKIDHKVSIYFYTDKTPSAIAQLESDWKEIIETKKSDLKEYFPSPTIEFRGSVYLTDIYERLNSNQYKLMISKSEVIEADEGKYLIGYITAKELLDSIAPKTDSGLRNMHPDIFKNNIRLYLGQNDINKRIETTLIEEPSKFHYYNNGLTITTKEIKADNSRNFVISPINIVNGCQTTNSIYNAHKNPHFNESIVKIPVKIIVAQDVEYENITIRTNSQNSVDIKDLLSISSIQKELEDNFSNCNLFGKTFFYKRQKGADIDTDADYIIHIDDIIRAALSTLFLIPDKVSGYFDKTTSKYIDNIFDERYVNIYVLLTAILKEIETYSESYEININRLKYHILYLIYRIAAKDIEYRTLEDNLKSNIKISDLDDADIESTTKIINTIYSNIYKVAQNNNIIKIITYILGILKSNYNNLVNIRTKADERILYKAVEKLKRVRVDPVFSNFEEIFTKTIDEITNE